VVMSGMAVIILAGRFWKRATWQGALAALIVAPAVSLAVMFLPGILSMPIPAQGAGAIWGTPAIPAFIAGLAAHIVTSLLTPRRARTFEEVAAHMREAREAIEAPQAGQIPNPEIPK